MGHQLLDKLPADLLRAPLVWVHHGGVILSLQSPYVSPYAVLRRGHRSFTISVRTRDEVFSTICLKPCRDDATEPGSPHCHGRPPTACGAVTPIPHHQCSPPNTRWVSFLDLLVSAPSQRPSEQPSRCPGNVLLLPARGFCTPWDDHSTAAVPAVPLQHPCRDRNIHPCCWWAVYSRLAYSTPRGVHTCTVNNLACIYSAMYSVIN